MINKLTILPDWHPFLSIKQEETKQHPDNFQWYIDEMFRVMKENNGVGLAANQVGINFNMFVMSINEKDYVVINPKILQYSNKQVEMTEGCLSFSKQFYNIKRSEKIVVEYMNRSGEIIKETMDGLAARCFLHEFDHINGITFQKYIR